MGYRHQPDELKKKSTRNHIDVVSPRCCYIWGMHSDDHGDRLRRRIRAEVAARRPVDHREAISIERFLEAFGALAAPFDQDVDPFHVTGSGIVVGPRGVVLLEHKRLGIWLQPGGHIDPGETPWDAALRESREETGLDVSFAGPLDDDGVPELLHVDVHAGGRGHTHLDLRYLIDGGDADPDPPEGESQQLGWFAWDVAIARADPGLRGLLESLTP
jgi:8-oxo-dGTP pyrophosphatase MutT (NUDIX family)